MQMNKLEERTPMKGKDRKCHIFELSVEIREHEDSERSSTASEGKHFAEFACGENTEKQGEMV